MSEIVGITIESQFDIKDNNPQSVYFYTEGVLDQTEDTFVYTYDETEIFGSKKPVTAHIELGKDYLIRTIKSEKTYIMFFRKDEMHRTTYHTNIGEMALNVYTEVFDNRVKDGYGSVEVIYKISFEDGVSIQNLIKIGIKKI